MVDGDKTGSGDAAAIAVSRLAELTTALGASFDEQRILSATMAYLGQFAPSGARLFYLHLNPQGAPRSSQPVAQWHRDGVAAQRIYEARYPLADGSLLKRCLDHG